MSFFFFKQKTAYEMRISDWSSDVCSSDLVAQDAVNQGAAVVLTSVDAARRAGIAPGKHVYLHGYAAFQDRLVSERIDLSRSRAIEAALQSALNMAGKAVAAINQFDLYSCFPCAVLLAAETLGIAWHKTPCTVTGGQIGRAHV